MSLTRDEWMAMWADLERLQQFVAKTRPNRVKLADMQAAMAAVNRIKDQVQSVVGQLARGDGTNLAPPSWFRCAGCDKPWTEGASTLQANELAEDAGWEVYFPHGSATCPNCKEP